MKAKIGQNHALKDIVKISRYLLVSRYFLMFPNDAIYCFRDISRYKTLNPAPDQPCEEDESANQVAKDNSFKVESFTDILECTLLYLLPIVYTFSNTIYIVNGFFMWMYSYVTNKILKPNK